MWVVRHSLTSPDQLEKLLEVTLALRMDILLVQVNGRGEAYYNSTLLPKDPSIKEDFDPLAYLLSQAKALDVEIHAWINAYTVGSFSSPPMHPNHLLVKHPSWVLVDDKNRSLLEYHPPSSEALPTFMLEPGLLEVQDFLTRVYGEVASSYPVHGIHLDFLRYPSSHYGYHPVNRKQFKELTGYDPLEILKGERETDRDLMEEWDSFRRKQVTTLLKKVYQRVKGIGPNLTLSAAIYPDLQEALHEKFQDWPAWVEEGLLDILFPMTYDPSIQVLKRQVQEVLSVAGERLVYPGLGAYRLLKEPWRLLQMIDLLKELPCGGFSLFSYDSLVKEEGMVEYLKGRF